MEQYNITGMSCAACSARIEKAVSKLEGVNSCSVSLLTNTMGVEGTAKADDIIAAVKKAGYGAALKGAQKKSDRADNDSLKDRETPKLIKRLITSLVFLLPLMYVSMGHTMWGWYLPDALSSNPVAIGLIQMILAAAVMIINGKFFTNGFSSLFHGAPNMDALVALGSGTAFVYSTYGLFALSGDVVAGNMGAAMARMHGFYLESAAMILTLITVGKTLEARSKGKTTNALKELMKLAPEQATILVDGLEKTVPVSQVKKGDKFIVRPGESIPVDGVIISGDAALDESALTGESIPVDKSPGDTVSAATLNKSGFITCEATRVGEDTMLSQIIKMVSDAAATKAPIAKVADKVSGIFVPVVIGIALITFVVWMLLGKEFSFALARGITVLVISCPCALGLATPVAIMVGNGKGAKNGILFKTAVSLEQTGKAQIVVLDKTGTITSGNPVVTDIIPVNAADDDELLKTAFSLEVKSEHPLATAVNRKAAERGITPYKTDNFKVVSGSGLFAEAEGKELYGGNFKFIITKCDINPEIKAQSQRLSEEGKTPLFFSSGGKLAGIIAVADALKSDSRQAISELKDMGIKVVMLTGDNAKTAAAIGAEAGVDKVIAGVLPDGKAEVVKRLKEKGKVVMVGDGINDAPALTSAHTGMAIGAGTDVAIDAADVVLMNSSLQDVPAAIRLSRATLRNIHQNLFWAFIYNLLGIPLAAGVFTAAFGWSLSPMFGAAAMSLSSFCVVTNALRLNLFNLRSAKKIGRVDKVDLDDINFVQGDVNMEKEIKVEGMMCPHCEAAVKNALEKLDFVDSAAADHESGSVKMALNAQADDAAIKAAVESAGYKVK